MNYKELFEKYKNGIANEEEKRIVEEELEKYEAIEEYLSQIIDEKSVKAEDFDILEDNKEETSKLIKDVKKRLRKVGFTSAIIVIVFLIVVFYGLPEIIDLFYYDPTNVSSANSYYTADSVGNIYNTGLPNIYFNLVAHVSLNMPGYAIRSVSAYSKGFGEYEVVYSLKNLFEEEELRTYVDIIRNRVVYKGDTLDYNSQIVLLKLLGFEAINNLFEDDSPDHISAINRQIQRRNEETIKYFQNLNPLSYVSMAIVFDKDLDMKEFYNLTAEMPSLDFKWVGIRTVEPGKRWRNNQSLDLIGFNPSFNDEPIPGESPDSEKYPLFYLVDSFHIPINFNSDYETYISQVYETHFKSRLQYLIDQEEFVKIFENGNRKIEFYQDALDYINEHGVKTYGVLVYGKVEAFLENIDKIPYSSLYINKVLPVKPNIYY